MDTSSPRRFRQRKNEVEGVSLEHHLETQIDLQFAAIKEAVKVAKEGMEKRLDAMNEFRDALKDQASRFVTRNELLAIVVGISTLISAIIAVVVRFIK